MLYPPHEPRRSARLTGAFALGLLLAACGKQAVVLPLDRNADAASAGADASSPPPDGTFALPHPDDSAPPTAEPDAGTCAAETIGAKRVPLDVYLLLDASSSMNIRVSPTRTRWELIRDAIAAFVSDPHSDGLGVGLGMFPLMALPCQTDADCAPAFGDGAIPPGACKPPLLSGACVNAKGAPAVSMIGETIACTAWLTSNPSCAAGEQCVQAGNCAVSGESCTNVGKRCPAGNANNTCDPPPSDCTDPTEGACWNLPYRTPAVPIAVLPGAGNDLLAALDRRRPKGGTPLDVASQGALAYLRTHLGAQAGHRGLLVVATDGSSHNRCEDDAAIAANIAQAKGSTPAIATYAIAVRSDGLVPPNLDRLAAAGGSGKALVVQPNQDLAGEFRKALDQIRGATLPCQYGIPQAQGGPLDFGKVNVHFASATRNQDVLYTGSAARCDPTRGGWYYDVDPATGGAPTKIEICPASCAGFNAELQGEVQLRIGCATRTIE